MKFILISAPEPVKGEWEMLAELFRKGLSCFHLRKPGGGLKGYREALANIEPAFYKYIVLHEFPELVGTFGLKGYHLREDKRLLLQNTDWRKMKHWKTENGYSLSTSVHQPAGWLHLNPGYDYAFLSPVFDSISKAAYRANQTWQRPIRPKTACRAIALGGIDIDKLGMLADWQYDGVAVLGAVWEEPEKAVEQGIKFIEACQKLVRMC